MFTVHKIDINGKLSNKEHLNNDELDHWMVKALHTFNKIRVEQDLTGKVIVYEKHYDETGIYASWKKLG